MSRMSNEREVDEDRHNEEWLENAQMYFEEAVELDNLKLALAVIDDVAGAGFASQVNVMRAEINRIANERKEAPSIDELINHLEDSGQVPKFYSDRV